MSGNDYIGGLVGRVAHGGSIVENSYATGDVSGLGYVGGLVGHINSLKSVEYCYATGKVEGEFGTGGLVGGSTNGSVTASYYNSETTEQSDTGKGEPRTTAQMITGTPSDTIYTGWNTEIWDFGGDDDYPILKGLPGQKTIRLIYF